MSSTIMFNPDADDEAEPQAVRTIATALADGVRFVQGAGGNISAKRRNTLWVKASGTRFADADRRPIFVRMDLSKARERALVDEDLRSACTPGSDTDLRPSIEAAFHAVMPQPVVVHVHSVGAVAAAVGPLEAAVGRLGHLGRVIAVPYRRPGRPLAVALVEAGAPEGGPASECIVLLANHGLIVAAADPARVLDLVRRVEDVLAPHALAARDASSPSRAGRVRLFPPGTVASAAREVLVGGVLTPDSAVFLGARPFGVEGDTSATGVIAEDGAVWIPDALSDDAAQVAESLVLAAGLVEGAVRYLTAADVAELVDWDAEKWRQEQQR